MIHLTKSEKDMDTIVADLEAAVEKHEFGVLHVHDLRSTMNAKGVPFARDCRILEVCNPRHAADILERNMQVSLALPCRISVYAEAGGVVVGTLLPTDLMDVFGKDPAMMKVAEEVEGVLRAIIDEAV
jgi:uncharacterized protein (DUF302 family)